MVVKTFETVASSKGGHVNDVCQNISLDFYMDLKPFTSSTKIKIANSPWFFMIFVWFHKFHPNRPNTQIHPRTTSYYTILLWKSPEQMSRRQKSARLLRFFSPKLSDPDASLTSRLSIDSMGKTHLVFHCRRNHKQCLCKNAKVGLKSLNMNISKTYLDYACIYTWRIYIYTYKLYTQKHTWMFTYLIDLDWILLVVFASCGSFASVDPPYVPDADHAVLARHPSKTAVGKLYRQASKGSKMDMLLHRYLASWIFQEMMKITTSFEPPKTTTFFFGPADFSAWSPPVWRVYQELVFFEVDLSVRAPLWI